MKAHLKLKNCNRVFKEGFPEGVLAIFDLNDFPQEVSDVQRAISLVRLQEEIIEEYVTVEFLEDE